jgi:hypothetical protein
MPQDWKLIRILTDAVSDCEPQSGRTSPALRLPVIELKPSGRGRWHHGLTSHKKYVKMYIKTSFSEIMSEVKNNLEEGSAGIGI